MKQLSHPNHRMDPEDVLIDTLLKQPIPPSEQFTSRVMQALQPADTELPAPPEPVVFTAPWWATLGGLAAATVIGALAFYAMFSNAPEPHYPSLAQNGTLSVTAPVAYAALENTPLSVDELLYLDEMLQPMPYLAGNSWDTIEAMLY